MTAVSEESVIQLEQGKLNEDIVLDLILHGFEKLLELETQK